MSVHALGADRELDSIPFAHAFEAFVASARCDLDLSCFSDGALASLERHLVSRLSFACGPALQREFEAFDPPGSALLSLFLSGAEHSAPTHRYQAFVATLLRAAGWDGFFEKYPVARRIVKALIDDWRDSCSELASRVRRDLASRGVVESLQIGISDPHNGGRVVVLLFFANGSALVYKPRPVDLEWAFSEFLNWCNDRLALPEMSWYAPRVTPREGYGWMQYIEPRPCLDRSDLRHFYRSAGGLLALLYLLGSTDCHCENLIAYGRFPVLVDAETLLQPRYTPPVGIGSIEAALDPLGWDTVARTGFLPRWEITDDGLHVADVSGLAGNSEHAAAPGPVWIGANLDVMRLVEGPMPASPSYNRAALASGPVDPLPWFHHVEVGFEETCAALERVKNELPLAAFASLKTRFIYRPTQLYANLLWRSVQPENLSSLERHRAVFEDLYRPFEGIPQSLPELPLVKQEIDSLERRDIPFFTIACETRCCGGIPLNLLGSAWANLSDRAHHWGARPLARQRAIVRGSLRAFSARPVPFVETAIPFPGASISEDSAATDLLLSSASDLAEELRNASFESDAGRQWLGLEARDFLDRFQLEPLGLDLYGGSCGVALFFAAAGKVLCWPDYSAIAREALAPLCRILRAGSPATLAELGARLGPGAACGVGSVIYSLTRSAILLDDSALLEDARRASRLLTPEVILADRYFDVVGGIAGGILGVLALYETAPHPDLLATARSCGERLLAVRSGEPGRRAWCNFARQPLPGLAHGAAGVALALQRLSRCTGCDEFDAAALEARAYERSLFDPARSNWPDLRDNVIDGGQPGFATSWCHGAPGVGFSRLDSIADNQSACLLEIEAALSATLDYGIMGPDYLCCGNMGRIEWILAAGVCLNREDLLAQARAAAACLCRRAKADGGFRLLSDTTADGFKPGFFRGTAGIGYSLLRCAAPAELPCILAFE